MKQAWQINEAYQGSAFAAACSSLEAVFALQGEVVSKDRISDVIRVSLDGKTFYVKRYYQPRRKRVLNRLLRSRIRAEWENLTLFARLGIPTPPLAAFGECYRGRHYQGALITEELVGAQDLASLCKAGSVVLNDPAWFAHTARQVGHYTQLLHAQRFMHVDLKWRNILVDATRRPQVYFFDCPSGRRLPALLFRRGRLKDLACLDKLGRKRLRRTQRLAFYKYYAGCVKLTPQDKALVRRVERFSAYLEGESRESGWRFF